MYRHTHTVSYMCIVYVYVYVLSMYPICVCLHNMYYICSMYNLCRNSIFYAMYYMFHTSFVIHYAFLYKNLTVPRIFNLLVCI